MLSLLKKTKIYKKSIPIIRTSFLYKFYKKNAGAIANFFNDKVTDSFFVVWVTGTNGKTTTANLIGHIFNEKVAPTIVISSVYSKIKWQIIPHKKKWEDFTIFDIQNLLTTAKNYGCQIAVIEISSAWLKQFAYEGLAFDSGVLTNISRDHVNDNVDFHHYETTKKELFKKIIKNSKNNKFAVFPKDDKMGRKWFDEMPFDKKLNFGINSSAIVRAENIKTFFNGSVFSFDYLGKTFEMKTPLVGTYNINNILAALGVVFEAWLQPKEAIDAAQSFNSIQWRMERLSYENKQYYFDIAHSPDALNKTLQFLWDVKWQWRLIVVFGSPGNKDQNKRQKMWKIVAHYADIMIATDSEANHENRLQILDDLTSKISTKKEWESLFVLPEREFAIKFALEIAKENDFILFAWRPRHGYQKTNTGKKKWDDIVFVKKVLWIK